MAAPKLTPESAPGSTVPPALASRSYFVLVSSVAALYVLAARAGLGLDAVSGFASLVWAPSGIALAALVLGGRRIWPGVFLGALVANVLTGANVLVAVGIATGNTLEAIAGAYALSRMPGFQPALDRVRDALSVIVFAATLSTTISATIGVASLYLGGVVAPGAVAETWRTWWVGDAIGVLLVAPLILVWVARPGPWFPPRRLMETAALILGLVTASILIFVVPQEPGDGPLGDAYVFFPLMMWAAIRLGQRGAVTATIVVSVIAISGTVMSRGPFVEPTLHESLFVLQIFLGITGATFLVLGASISERERSKEALRTARDTATGANRAKAEFLAVMSHELRTPLNAISGYAQLLAIGVSGPLTEKQTDAVARIRANQQHLLSLIDDILSFAKVEAGRIPVSVELVRVCDTLDSLDALLRPDLTRRDLTMIWSGCDATLAVRADPVKLRQVLLNVIGNSIKFTPAGGRIELSATRLGDDGIIQVSDTGVGIPADMIDRVFEPFFQVDTGMTREYPGVGLGLAISRDFVRAMGGEIEVRSGPGKGCVVTIALPVAHGPLSVTS